MILAFVGAFGGIAKAELKPLQNETNQNINNFLCISLILLNVNFITPRTPALHRAMIDYIQLIGAGQDPNPIQRRRD
jgi:hypothetical protein